MAKFSSREAEKLSAQRILELSRESFGIWQLPLKSFYTAFLISTEMGNHAFCYTDLILQIALSDALKVIIYRQPPLGN